jgi:hypothetical protein
MPCIRVAFRYGDTRLFSRLVCIVRGGDSAHVEVSAHSVADMHSCISASFVDWGVRLKIMPLPAEKWRVYQTDIPSGRAYDWLRANGRRGYGWLRLVRFVFPWFRPNVGGPICTTAVGEMLGLSDTECHDLRSLESAVRLRWGDGA